MATYLRLARTKLMTIFFGVFMKFAASLLAVLFLVGACFAQENKTVQQPDWVLTVTTSGGFGGAGKGNFRVTSRGDVYRLESTPKDLVGCNGNGTGGFSSDEISTIAPLDDELFNSLTMAIDSLPSFEVLQNRLAESRKSQVEPTLANACSDCYQTHIHILRREPNGSTSSFNTNLLNVQNYKELTALSKITDEIFNTASVK